MTASKKYTDDEFKTFIDELQLDWIVRDGGVEKSYEFPDFVQAFQFMGKVAVLAESQNHHPEWTNVYNKVFIRFSTHYTGGLTQRDLDMVNAVELLLKA